MSRVPYSLTAIRSDDDSSGKNIVPYASVSVVDANGNPAQIYLQETGGSPSSHFALNENGFKQIWAEPGRYTITIDGGETYDIFLTGDLSDRVQSVATIADLRAVTPNFDGQQMMLLGHTIKGFGGGIFYHDSSSTAADDNGMTVVTSGGARWLRKTNGRFVSIEYYGAVPGQSAEITGMVQSAIDWAHASSTIKMVVIPAGSWNMDTVYLRRGITLQGAGKHVTRLYQSKLPTVEGMIRADRSHDASNSRVYDLSVYGNDMVPARTNLLKGILFEEVTGFECGRCHAENLSSYGFWAHTPHNTPSQYMCKDGLFYDLSTNNVEHAFETKRAENIRWVRCVAVGNAQYSDSAFHPWERSKNISYEQCEAYGDFKDSAIKLIGSNDPGNEGNNKNISFDVFVSLNQSGMTTPNNCARVYRGDDVTIKGKLRGFSGILWGGGSGNLTLDAELDVVIAGLQSDSTELASGGLFGNLLVRLSAPLGVGQITNPAFIVQQNGEKYIHMDELRVSYITDNSINAVRFGGVSSAFRTIHVRGGNTSLGVYNSTIKAEIIDLAGNTGAYAVCYAENSDIEARIKSNGFSAIVAEGSKIKCLDGSRLEGRATVNVGAGSTLTGTAEIISDATNIADSSYGVSVAPTGQINLTNSSLTHINAGSLPTDSRILNLGTGSKVNLSQCDLRSDRPGASIVFYTPNTMVNNCTANGVSFSLDAVANKSMMIGNVVDTATADASTGSVITEVVR